MKDITFEINKMIIAVFVVINQADKVRFFEKTFLIISISLNITLKIYPLIF